MTSFLRQFWTICVGYFHLLVNVWPPSWETGATIARALTTRRHLKPLPVNPRGYMPVWNKFRRIYETSVVQSTGMSTEAIVTHIKLRVLRGATCKLHGVAEVKVSALGAPFSARRDRLPIKHAAIVGWPHVSGAAPEDINKEDWIELAQDIADNARLL